MDVGRGRSELTSGTGAGNNSSHTRIMVFLASSTEAGYPRCRPAIAASLPAPTLGRPLIFPVFNSWTDGSPYIGESRRSPLQRQWWDLRIQRFG